MSKDEKRILVVDDDVDFVESMSSLLEANHFKVVHAANGDEAVMQATADPPDLILMDIMMGERTEGLFTVQQIRRIPELRRVPIFILSALYSAVPDFYIPLERAWGSHDEFLSKPVDPAQLIEKIHDRIGVPQ